MEFLKRIGTKYISKEQIRKLPKPEQEPLRIKNWYARKMVKGKRHVWCTKTPDYRTAEQRAIAHFDLITAEAWDLVDSQKARAGLATVGELCTAYLAFPKTIDPRTETGAVKALRDLVEAIHSAPGDKHSTRLLTDELVYAYQDKITKRITETDDRLERVALENAAAALLRKAQSVVSPKYARAFRELNVPDFGSFRTARPFRTRRLPHAEIPAETIEALIQAAEDCYQGKRERPLWTVFALGFYAGMRNSEIVRARRSWLINDTRPRINIAITAAADTKGHDDRFVRLPDFVINRLLADLEHLDGDPHLVQPIHTTLPNGAKRSAQAQRILDRRYPEFLRAHGLEKDTSKLAYRLRRDYLNRLTQNFGLDAAAGAAGHDDNNLTRSHYASQTDYDPNTIFKDPSAR